MLKPSEALMDQAGESAVVFRSFSISSFSDDNHPSSVISTHPLNTSDLVIRLTMVQVDYECISVDNSVGSGEEPSTRDRRR